MFDTPIYRSKNKKKKLFVYSFIMMLAATSILFSVLGIVYYYPAFEQEKVNTSNNIEMFYMGNKVNTHAIEQDGVFYLPFTFMKEYIDPTIQWDEKGKMAIITTNEDVFHLPLGKKEGLLNLEPYSFTYPVKEVEGEIYLPVVPIQDYYDLSLDYSQKDSIIIIHDLTQPIQRGIVVEQTKLRKQPAWISHWITEVAPTQEVLIMKEVNGWYWVESTDGSMGYIDKNKVMLTDIEMHAITKEIYQPWNPIGKPIVLTWEYSSSYKTKIDKSKDLVGLQVVSPTWFHLQKDGLVKNNADINYVDWAHTEGYQVWGLFSNSFDPELTHDMLSNTSVRIEVIKQLLSYVDLYQLDGINIDFENVYLKDRELLVQFIRELTPLLHEKDRTVSMDVTFKSKNENWSLFYDRKLLGEVVDYMIVMGYDEHWASSPKAGSVASLPWVENGLKGLLEDVPNDKIILGVPFYTRLWIEEEDGNGQVTVKSKTLTMEKREQWIEDNNANISYDQLSGQNYVEVKKGNTTYKIWIEDELSMEKRVELMKQYRLAGIAAWRKGFEHEEFWTQLGQMIEKRP